MCLSVGLALALLPAIAGSAVADVVHQVSGAPYEGTIVNIDATGLVLKWKVSNANKSFPLISIQKLAIDGQTDFNAAEDQVLAEDYKKAIQGYERAKLRAGSKWFKDYINARLVTCFGKTEQFSRAVRTYIELCQSGTPLTDRVDLPPAMPKGSADNDTALKAIDAILAASPNIGNADKLKQLRLNIRLVQGDPAEVLAEIEQQLESPNVELQSQMRLKHIELLLASGKIKEAQASLAIAKSGQGEKFKPLDAMYEPDLLFFEGQVLYAAKDYLHAALSFMRVPIHYARSKKTLSAEALYWAGKAMLDSQEVPLNEVASPLKEAVEKFSGTEGATKARKLLDQLSSNRP